MVKSGNAKLAVGEHIEKAAHVCSMLFQRVGCLGATPLAGVLYARGWWSGDTAVARLA